MSINYKDSGVDVEAGYKSVELMKEHVKTTFTEGVITDIGGFGGLFSLARHKMDDPVLVSGTDGVGTKLKIAFALDQHDTIGIDCVAMCVNDIICSGAQPLFFLDYIACGKNVPEKIANIVSGIAKGCREAGAALIGGETAEMPGLYDVDEYDLAGFAVGIVDKKEIIDGSKIVEGDVLIGLASSGIHSNGYSLVRKIFEPTLEKLSMFVDDLGSTLGEQLIKPTKIYVNAIKALKDEVEIKAIGHITGGGFIENIPRMLPKDFSAEIKLGSWPIQPIFKLMKDLADLEENVMFNTFNMGIGMIVIVPTKDAQRVVEKLEAVGEKAYAIGVVKKGSSGVTLC